MYLILDTNIWIYLANGFNPETNNYEDGLHFKILGSLKHLVSIGKIKLLTNDLILEEWGRNRQQRFLLIEKHRKTLEGQINNLKSIKKKLDQEDGVLVDTIIEKYENKFQLEINNNLKHVEEVEDLLNNFTVKFQIKDSVKIKVTDWAVNKKAPFKGDKSNSTADALILFGSIDYLTEISKNDLFGEPIYIYPESIFVSGNTGDFSNKANKTELHSDLIPIVSPTKMKYDINLGKVINAIEELFKESEIQLIEEEIDEWNEFYCEVCDPGEERIFYNVVHFGGSFEIESQKEIEITDPNQLSIFLDGANSEPTEPEKYLIEIGTCQYCDQEYLHCLRCNTINIISDEFIQCEGCEEIYKQVNEYLGDGMYDTSYIVVDSSDVDDNED